MEVLAKMKFSRIAPRKSRLVIDVIRGMNAIDAVNQLKVMNKKAAGIVLKLLQSAIANAENNFGLVKSNLYIKKIMIGEGPILYRWMPKAMGRATPIRKRTSHIEVILDEKVASKKTLKEEKKAAKADAVVSQPGKEIEAQSVMPANEKLSADQSETKGQEIFDKSMAGKHRVKQQLDKKTKKDKGFLKKVFQRKSA